MVVLMETFEEFGLSSYEIKVYLALLSTGMNTARQLSSKSGVPFGRIYDVLTFLENKGIVEKQSSRPMKFLPVPPHLAIQKLLALKEEELQSVTKKAALLEEQLNKIYRESPQESSFWKVSFANEYSKNYYEKIIESKKELLTYFEFNEMKLEKYEEIITEFLGVILPLVKRGVRIYLLLGIENDRVLQKISMVAAPFLKYLNKIHIKITSTIATPFDVIDSEKVWLRVRNPINEEEYFVMIFLKQRKFAEELKNKFQEMWREASVFKTELERINVLL
jgi:sugar-specific transcriptional regulator TrmB